MAFGPMITALSLQLGALSPREYVTEAFTWSMTVFMVGLGAGFWLGGLLVQSHGFGATLWAAAAFMGLAALWCLRVPQVREH
jgi:predicted MFS family arabinose efflux permease